MTEFAITVLASMGGSAILAACLVWLGKTWISERLKNAIQHEYDQKLESIKAKLHAENSIALEQLKSDLRVAAQQREVKFSQLHEKRAESIESLHSLLQDLAVAVAAYRRARIEEGNAVEKRQKILDAQKKVDKCINSFGDCFRSKKIYLPKELEAQVLKLQQTVVDSARRIAEYACEGADDEQLTNISTKFDDSIKELFDDLKGEFRRLLGDDV